MKRKIFQYSTRLSWMLILAVLSVLFVFSCEQTTGPDDTSTEATRKLLIYSDKNSIVENTGSAVIYVKVYANDDTTNVVSGTNVQFAV